MNAISAINPLFYSSYGLCSDAFTLVTRGEELLRQFLDRFPVAEIEKRNRDNWRKRREAQWKALGPECGPESCVEPGCDRLRIELAVRCFIHQLIWGNPLRFNIERSELGFEENPPFSSIVHTRPSWIPVIERLKAISAVILEQHVHGNTSWYYCQDECSLAAIEARLCPGSIVNFYFDNRIKNAVYSANLKEAILRLISEKREIVLGTLEKGSVEIRMVVGAEPSDLEEFEADLDDSVTVFYGVYPELQNSDGFRITLPDPDGIVRPHPH